MNLIAAISGDQLLHAVVWVIIAGVIFWLVNWLITYVGIPEPFNKVAKVIVAIVAVVFLVNALLTIVGKPFITL
jgi:ABC-type enterochelin transport system permease subunit